MSGAVPAELVAKLSSLKTKIPTYSRDEIEEVVSEMLSTMEGDEAAAIIQKKAEKLVKKVGGGDIRPFDIQSARPFTMLTEDERLVQDTVARFTDERVLPIIGGCFDRGEFPRELIPEIADLGLLGSSLPAEYGGAGMNAVSYGLICQELERGDSGIRSFVSVQSSLCMYPIFAYGSEEQKRQYLPDMAAGKVIGWFQGRMEFGPRALGGRSILGDARNERMQSVMNLKIKYRESFRPFAPSVVVDAAERDHGSSRPSRTRTSASSSGMASATCSVLAETWS